LWGRAISTKVHETYNKQFLDETSSVEMRGNFQEGVVNGTIYKNIKV